jgi:hypothetical protein
MPILVHHEFTFGDVPCLVITDADTPPWAEVYVIVAEGYGLRPLVDSAGHTIKFLSLYSTEDALALAANYLEHRFGRRGPARSWKHLTPGAARTVVSDTPLWPGETY